MLIVLTAFSASTSENWLRQGRMAGTDSQKAQDALGKIFKDGGQGDYSQSSIVFESKDAIRAHEAEITKFLNTIADAPKYRISKVVSPFTADGASQISDNGADTATIAYATITFKPGGTGNMAKLGPPIVEAAKELRSSITVEFSGVSLPGCFVPAVRGTRSRRRNFHFAGGIRFDRCCWASDLHCSVRYWARRGVDRIGIASGRHAGVHDTACGHDRDRRRYRLCTVHRHSLPRCDCAWSEPLDATVEAIATAGRGVLFAGITVVISLLGMFVIGMDFVNGLASCVDERRDHGHCRAHAATGAVGFANRSEHRPLEASFWKQASGP